MEMLFFIGLAAAFGYWAFQHGKRLGSRRAYRIGRRHGRGQRALGRRRNNVSSLHPKGKL